MIRGLHKKTITAFVFLSFFVAVLSQGPALAKKYEKEDIDELEWLEFLSTDLAKVSTPASENVYYNIVNPRNGGFGVRGTYQEHLRKAIKDEREGYDMYDGLGLLDRKWGVFYYNKPKSKRNNVGWIVYDCYQVPFWYVQGRSKDELNKRMIRYMLGSIDDIKLTTPVSFYKEKKGGREYSVLKYGFKEKGKNYTKHSYYIINDDYSICHYFNRRIRLKTKYTESAREVCDQMITSSILVDELDDNSRLKYMLYSARALLFDMLTDKRREKQENSAKKKAKIKDEDQAKIVTVEHVDTGKKEEIDLSYEKVDDFPGRRKMVLDELDRLAAVHPEDPRIYYAQAVLCEYDDAGERYGDGFNEAQVFSYYKKAVDADADYYYAFYNAGILHARNNNTDKAIEYFKKCIEISPIDIVALYRLGQLIEEQGKYNTAYSYYWQAKQTLTKQEKAYCPKLQKKLWKRCNKLVKKPGVKRRKKSKDKRIIKSNMTWIFHSGNLYTEITANVFSYDEGFIFWHGYLRNISDRSYVKAKWYSPDGAVFKEENSVEKVKNDVMSYYFALPIDDTEAANKTGVWKIDVYFKGEVIDTKHFYILDC